MMDGRTTCLICIQLLCLFISLKHVCITGEPRKRSNGSPTECEYVITKMTKQSSNSNGVARIIRTLIRTINPRKRSRRRQTERTRRVEMRCCEGYVRQEARCVAARVPTDQPTFSYDEVSVNPRADEANDGMSPGQEHGTGLIVALLCSFGVILLIAVVVTVIIFKRRQRPSNDENTVMPVDNQIYKLTEDTVYDSINCMEASSPYEKLDTKKEHEDEHIYSTTNTVHTNHTKHAFD